MTDSTYLHELLAWLGEPASKRWLGEDWDRCRQLADPDEAACLIQRPDLHVVQTTTLLLLTV